MSERDELLDQIGASWIRLMALGLPEQTSSLLDYDLTLQQVRAFAFVLGQGETPVHKVAEALGIKPSVATGIIQRLVERGLVQRHEDPRDRRIRLLTVTERGVALVDELSGIVLARGRAFIDRLSDDQLRQMRDLFSALTP